MTSGHKTSTIKLRYFAWVREKVGLAEEEVCLPADVVTVAELMNWLQARGETYQAAFAKPEIIRAALDQTHARADAPIGGAREVAFFPPVTGG